MAEPAIARLPVRRPRTEDEMNALNDDQLATVISPTLCHTGCVGDHLCDFHHGIAVGWEACERDIAATEAALLDAEARARGFLT